MRRRKDANMRKVATNQSYVKNRQTGYDALAEMLRARYPEGVGITLGEFMDVEAALAVAIEVGGTDVDVYKVDRLLCNYSLLRPYSFGGKDHLMQMARRSLLRLSSSTNWNRLLDLYLQKKLDRLRCFEVVGAAVRVKPSLCDGMERQEIYLEHILEHKPSYADISVAKPGDRCAFSFKPEATAKGKVESVRTRYVTMTCQSRGNDAGKETDTHAKHTPDPIVVTLDEMIQVAHDIGVTTGKEYYAAVLERARDKGLFKHMTESRRTDCVKVDIHQITSLVGLVGAGKSVFANVLMVALARRGLRMVTLLSSVSDVMETVTFLRSVGVEASPLVSNRDRIAHLNEIFDRGGTMLLDDHAARYLETPCIVDGLSEGEPEACSYVDVPCWGLVSVKGDRCACPYRDVCPTQAMVREAAQSSIVVTTSSGFATMHVGSMHRPFFEHALHNVDLVIFDEADRIQTVLDDCFAPRLSVQDLVCQAADSSAKAMKRPASQKTMDLNVEKFYDLQANTDAVAKSLLFSIKKEAVASWRIVRREAFTSLTLLEDLRERQNLPAPIADDLEKRIQGKESAVLLDVLVSVSCSSVDDKVFKSALNEYLKSKVISLDACLRERLSFMIRVIRFDEYLRELAEASDHLSLRDESVAGLYGLLRFSHVQQQRYLPSSLIGNVFGMSLGDGNDLVLFRQFAFGRALMGSLSWLETDRDGLPLGPHALLLSGSSYLPACLQYHVNRPVSYLLESEEWITEKVRNAHIADLGLGQHVSGSARNQRLKNLVIVLSGIAPTLLQELDRPGTGKVLVIVNSYHEAKAAGSKLDGLLRVRGHADMVCVMTRKSESNQAGFTQRSDVYRFSSHPARVLVAPALAIERGYNIVDEGGHATFGSVFFAVRPMGVPNDLGLRYRRMNGLMESRINTYPKDPSSFTSALRADAWKTWRTLEKGDRMGPSLWGATGMTTVLWDAITTQLAIVIQVFGRLLRLRDPNRPVPRLYFADAAFRGAEDGCVASFRVLDELARYLEWVIGKSEQTDVAQALYGPFYVAFKKGIQ